MRVTENPPNATKWSQEARSGECVRTRTIYSKKKSRWLSATTACHQLDCDYCGPKKRQADYEKALFQFSTCKRLFIVYVRASQVARLHRQAHRADHPTKSIPVAADWNAMISTYRWEGASDLGDDEMRRVFLQHRIAKRKLTTTGVWLTRKKGSKSSDLSDAVVVDNGFISHEAFANAAKRLKADIRHEGGDLWFIDHQKRPPEYVLEIMREEQRALQKQRREKRLAELARAG